VSAVEGRSTKLTFGAILCMAAGAMCIISAILLVAEEYEALETSTLLWIIMSAVAGIIAIVGGYYALRRRHFWRAIIGAVCALLSLPLLYLILPIAALILIWLSRREFQ
jgi:ABC-type branched-subunit amino acid transport system permease subunit